MSTPISPDPVRESGRNDLPAYVSNGLIGIRVVDIPLDTGEVLVNGFAGSHPQLQVDAAASAPYPVAGDLAINGVWLRTAPQLASFVEQSYDFSCGELHTRFEFRAEGVTATVDVLTLCSRIEPTIALQEITVTVSGTCELSLRSIVDVATVHGTMAQRELSLPGGMTGGPDGALAWASLGHKGLCGIAYTTELVGVDDAQREVLDWGADASLATQYTFSARPEREYRLRQIASVVPSILHKDPHQAAIRFVGKATADGFETLRNENRAEWERLWRSRVVIDADDPLWQSLADAAFYYLNSSVHSSAPSSTSMYGLATWHNYHYYYGHVMWDVDFFCAPAVFVSQPDAGRALLDFRTRTLATAQANAKLYGRLGIQFPWESGPLDGNEVAPGEGKAAWYEDHVSVDVAWSFAQFVHVSGDERFRRESAAPVLFGVSDWILSRVERMPDGHFSWPQTMGIAERKEPTDNDAYTLMTAKIVLDEAIATAKRLGMAPPSGWVEVRDGLRLPTNARSGAVTTHDHYRPSEEKGATPGPLAGIFPVGYQLDEDVEKRTLDYYLALAPEYIGSPMLSPLYGVWAAYAGDRRLALRLLCDGYADMVGGRFSQPLEMSPTKFPDKPRSGPFFANLGGFLLSLMYGFPGIRPSDGPLETWPSRAVVLPEGWRSISIERAWLRGAPAQIIARQGAPRADIRAS